jgi:hypothetical protein
MPRKPRILRVWTEHKPDESPDLSYLGEYTPSHGSEYIDRQDRGDMGRNEYRYWIPTNPDSAEQDYERMEAYNRGDWGCIGIIAKAEVQFSESSTIQTVRSGGLWGIESDSGKDYLESVENEELSQLADELKAIGCTDRQIKQAMKNVEHKA